MPYRRPRAGEDIRAGEARARPSGAAVGLPGPHADAPDEAAAASETSLDLRMAQLGSCTCANCDSRPEQSPFVPQEAWRLRASP